MHLQKIAVIPLLLLVNIDILNSSVIKETKIKDKDSNSESNPNGLYDSNDKVISVNNESFKHLVIWKPYVILMEFYNTYCGHCRRFSPKYKQLASELYSWRHSLKVMAIDCSDDDNNGICREYEVMAYPSLRYFHLNFEGSESSVGIKIDSQDVDEIRTILAHEIVKENGTHSEWPNFTSLHQDKTPVNFFEELPKSVSHGIVIFSDGNTTLPTEMILEFKLHNSVSLRRVTDDITAKKFKLNANKRIAVVDRTGNLELLAYENDSYKSYKEAITKYLLKEHLFSSITEESVSAANDSDYRIQDKHIREVIADVKSEKHLVYQADLEQAIKYTIFHEIPKHSNISGEALFALQRFINVLNKYNPLGSDGGKLFLKKLHEFVMGSQNQSIRGEEFESRAKLFASQFSPVFSSKNFVGCVASRTGLRGFTCSLWKLFHYLTVQDADNEHTDDPLEILQAMHGYVKYFFGCTDCSNHFQAMASRRNIWGSTTKDSSIVWLWEAHNEVNDRLKGDETEDPEFPKVQFPTKESCDRCYKDSINLSALNKPSWDKAEVLQFLKNIYHPNNISQYGLSENNDTLSPKNASQKSFKGVFSNLDLTVGMLLYGFCIVMMIVAVKLFVNKSYRRKYNLY